MSSKKAEIQIYIICFVVVIYSCWYLNITELAVTITTVLLNFLSLFSYTHILAGFQDFVNHFTPRLRKFYLKFVIYPIRNQACTIIHNDVWISMFYSHLSLTEFQWPRYKKYSSVLGPSRNIWTFQSIFNKKMFIAALPWNMIPATMGVRLFKGNTSWSCPLSFLPTPVPSSGLTVAEELLRNSWSKYS